MREGIISSVSYQQAEIIDNILKLYAPNGIDADLTYSQGKFYKRIKAAEPKLKFDIRPQTEDTVQADNRNLPLPDKSCQCVMFDPPFLATKGKSLQTENDGNLMLKRFTCYPTEKELFEYYKDSLREINRILADKGVAIIKCQDKVSSGRQYLSHIFLVNEAEKLGLYCEDLFIFIANNRVLSPKHSRQVHARKYHSYFLVFRKEVSKVKRVRREMYGEIH